MRILLAPATTGVSLEIKRSLNHAKNVDLIGCGYENESEAAKEFTEFIYFEVHKNPKELSDRLLKLTFEYNIDLIFVAHDQWLRDLTRVVIPNELISKIVNLPTRDSALLLSKKATYETLQILPLIPKVYINPLEIEDFPMFVKPDFGQGSRGAKKIASKSDLNQFLDSDLFQGNKQYVFSEYVPGPEFTVDCFSDSNSELIFCRSRIRAKVSNGIAATTTPYQLPNVEEWAQIISKQYSLNGAWFFQLKSGADGSLKLMEIGLRVAGASGLNRVLGVNLSQMQLYQFLGNSITVLAQNFPAVFEQSKNRARVQHKLEYAYFDYDDTIVGKRGINLAIRDFIVSLHEKGVKVNILTRSTRNGNSLLQESGLSQSINHVVSLRPHENKSDYIIKEKSFLFVDDSHRERYDVFLKHSNTGLVLDPSAFETDLYFENY